jgi:hypothetical protein
MLSTAVEIPLPFWLQYSHVLSPLAFLPTGRRVTQKRPGFSHDTLDSSRPFGHSGNIDAEICGKPAESTHSSPLRRHHRRRHQAGDG